jgi:hypothetical protein
MCCARDVSSGVRIRRAVGNALGSGGRLKPDSSIKGAGSKAPHLHVEDYLKDRELMGMDDDSERPKSSLYR